MSEDRNAEAVERYSAKIVKLAAQKTWEFSKAQIIVSATLAVASVPVGYLFGLVTSISKGILAALCVSGGAIILIALYNFLRAPAVIHREQQEEIARLRQQVPTAEMQQIPAPAAPAQVEPQPNLVCTAAGAALIEIEGDHDIVQRGWEHFALVAEFVNQPIPDRPIAGVDGVFAIITYFDEDGEQCQRVHHGSWMDEEWREIDFSISDTRYLVLAAQLIGVEDYRPEMDALRAVQNNHDHPARYLAPDYPYLPPTTSRVEVQLCSSTDGSVIGNFSFRFDLTQPEPTVTILGGTGT